MKELENIENEMPQKIGGRKPNMANKLYNLSPEDLIRGIIISEIIGKPLSKRRRRR